MAELPRSLKAVPLARYIAAKTNEVDRWQFYVADNLRAVGSGFTFQETNEPKKSQKYKPWQTYPSWRELRYPRVAPDTPVDGQQPKDAGVLGLIAGYAAQHNKKQQSKGGQ